LKISGIHRLPVPPEEAYAMMLDPEVLVRMIPGVESLEIVGPDEYKLKTQVPIAGAFDVMVRIADRTPPLSFRLIVDGTGKLGFVKGAGLLKFTKSGEQTEVTYEGDAQVGGTMAIAGARLIESTTRTTIQRFFERLAEEAAG